MKLIFLGTGGGRFVVFKQLRATGGLWVDTGEKIILIDPGPCSLLRILRSKRKLKVSKIDYIILTHRHLDHSADVNVIIEALTEGGHKKKGILIAPNDALKDDPVVLKFLRGFLKEIQIAREGLEIPIDAENRIIFSKRLIHPVETYGMNFYKGDDNVLSIIPDTKYFDGLADMFTGRNVVMNVVLLKNKGIQHLSIDDVVEFLKRRKPERLILTHFGMTVLRAKPWKIAEKLTAETGVNVIAARDGMEIEL